jgi:hypothetical protein
MYYLFSILFICSIIYYIINYNNDKPKMIYLGGASWGCAYYIGCYKGILKRWGNLKNVKIYGDSSGSLIALTMALRMPLDKVTQIYKDLALKAEKNGVIFKMTKYHNESLDNILINHSDYKRVNKKLNIGITTFPQKNVRVEEWNSNEDLRNDLHSSFHIPFYCRYPTKKGNQYSLDGALSADLGDFPRNALLIGVEGNYDLSGNLTTHDCLYPIVGKKFDKVVEKGYNDILNFKTYPKPKKTFYYLPLIIWWLIRIIEQPFTSKQ